MPAEIGNQYAKIYTDEELDKLIDDLLDWADNAKDLHIIGWTRKQKKTKSWLNWLAEKYPKFADAKEQAFELLGRKILNSSFYGQGNATVGMQYLPIYDKDFRELIKWKASLQNPRDEEDKVINVIRE